VNLPVEVSNPFPTFVITVVNVKELEVAPALGEVTVKATTFPENDRIVRLKVLKLIKRYI
jgi:hypothetical protein